MIADKMYSFQDSSDQILLEKHKERITAVLLDMTENLLYRISLCLE